MSNKNQRNRFSLLLVFPPALQFVYEPKITRATNNTQFSMINLHMVVGDLRKRASSIFTRAQAETPTTAKKTTHSSDHFFVVRRIT